MAIPLPKVFWPITIGATNCKIYFKQIATDYAATIAAATYYSAATLAGAVEEALNAVGGTGTWTVVVSSVGIFTLTNVNYTFQLRFSTFTTNTARSVLGYAAADAAASGSGPYITVANYQHQNGWYSPVAVKSDTGETFERPNTVITVAIGGQCQAIDENELTKREVEFAFLPAVRATCALDIVAGSTGVRAIENWWRSGFGRFRYWPDGTAANTYEDYFLDGSSLEDGFKIDRQFINAALYQTSRIKMRKFVA